MTRLFWSPISNLRGSKTVKCEQKKIFAKKINLGIFYLMYLTYAYAVFLFSVVIVTNLCDLRLILHKTNTHSRYNLSYLTKVTVNRAPASGPTQ